VPAHPLWPRSAAMHKAPRPTTLRPRTTGVHVDDPGGQFAVEHDANKKVGTTAYA